MSVDDDHEVESGPFCRHYGDPADCDHECQICGHTCSQHVQDDFGYCRVDECECQEWREKDSESS